MICSVLDLHTTYEESELIPEVAPFLFFYHVIAIDVLDIFNTVNIYYKCEKE